MTRPPVHIGFCSGFYGDRLGAAAQLVRKSPTLHVLSGDWLAELTMGILLRDRMKDPATGYAKTFLVQLRQVLADCIARDVRIVSNAGGVNPHGLADAVRDLAAKLGLDEVVVAVVDGDDVTGRLDAWRAEGGLPHLETGAALSARDGIPLAAHAYHGAWGIREALEAGAHVVITGRVTDAASVVGASAWWHGWARDAWDRLAGALAAGHVVECGAQATGGNYAFFDEVPSWEDVGWPIAAVEEDGSAVVTKPPGTGGLVSVGTVTAQLLYEIGGPAYASPDVTARFDTVRLEEVGPDQVRLHGTRGEPPPTDLKVGVLLAGGARNELVFLLGGARVDDKAAILAEQVWTALGGRERFAETSTQLLPGPTDPSVPAPLRLSRLVLSARDPDADKLGKAFSAPAVGLALASVPGLTLDRLPGRPRPVAVFWPTTAPAEAVRPTVHVPGKDPYVVPPPPRTPLQRPVGMVQPPSSVVPVGRTRTVPLGRLVGTRSGDKGGNANVGFWVRRRGHWHWLANLLTAERVRGWLGGFEGEVRIHPLPNLLAVNVELVGLLGEGVAANLAPDPQAKCLGEALRTIPVDVDEAMLAED